MALNLQDWLAAMRGTQTASADTLQQSTNIRDDLAKQSFINNLDPSLAANGAADALRAGIMDPYKQNIAMAGDQANALTADALRAATGNQKFAQTLDGLSRSQQQDALDTFKSTRSLNAQEAARRDRAKETAALSGDRNSLAQQRLDLAKQGLNLRQDKNDLAVGSLFDKDPLIQNSTKQMMGMERASHTLQTANITPEVFRELQSEMITAIRAGGSTSIHGEQKQEFDSAELELTKLMGYVSGNPQEYNNPKVKAQLADIMDRTREAYKNNMAARAAQIADGRKFGSQSSQETLEAKTAAYTQDIKKQAKKDGIGVEHNDDGTLTLSGEKIKQPVTDGHVTKLNALEKSDPVQYDRVIGAIAFQSQAGGKALSPEQIDRIIANATRARGL